MTRKTEGPQGDGGVPTVGRSFLGPQGVQGVQVNTGPRGVQGPVGYNGLRGMGSSYQARENRGTYPEP